MIKQYFEIQRADIDEDSRKVTVSFSSETPINTGYYKTLLMHDADSVDLSLLSSGASILFNHNPNVVLGRTENPRIEDRRGKVDIVFDADDEAEKYYQKVLNRSLTGISVGGNPITDDDVLLIEQGDFEYRDGQTISGPVKIYTHWRPHEISLTPIPADITVGVNRNQGENMEPKDVAKAMLADDSLKSMINSAVDAAIERSMDSTDTGSVETEANPLIDNQELIKRAGIVSDKCKCGVTDMIIAGDTETEISSFIIQQAMSDRKTVTKADDADNKIDMDADKFFNGIIG